MATRCEVIMIILLVLTLLAGILMATCISLVLKKAVGDMSVKFVSGRDLTIVNVNEECGCNVDGLEYEFKGHRRPSPGSDDFQAMKGGLNHKKKPNAVEGAIAEDTLYDDIPVDNPRFRFQYVNISSFPPSSHIPTTATPKTTSYITTRTAVRSRPPVTQLNNQDFVIDEEMLKSFWKKLNLPITAHAVEKRQFPTDAPHCPVPTLKEHHFDEHREKWKSNSYLVSISYQKFLDDPLDLRFLCSGFIIHKLYVLTGRLCTNAKPIHLLKIRSNSPYWSKHGTLREITQAVYTNNLALLKVHRNFQTFPDPVKIFPIPGAQPKVPISSSSAGWTVDNKEKFGRYSVVRWGKDCQSVDCERPVFGAVKRCPNSLGDPLIDDRDALIGVRSCQNIFTTTDEIQPLLMKFKIII